MYRRSQRLRQKMLRTQARLADPSSSPTTDFTHEQLSAFEAEVRGVVVIPGDHDYDNARQVFYRQFQCYPKIIVYCENNLDVSACLFFAGEMGLPIVCRSSGHSSAGFSINDGMVIDVSEFNSVHVDPDRKIAVVGAGTSFRRLNAKLQDDDMHLPGGGCDEVCVAGYMQGGGYGFTSRQYGMNCDNVIEFQMMLWNGGVVIANATSNPDLFWSVCGGMGTNFGILLSITYKISHVGKMFGFGLSWAAADAPAALVEMQSGYIDGMDKALLGYQCAIMPYEGEARLFMRAIYNGSKEDCMAAIASLDALPGRTWDIQMEGTYEQLNQTLLEKPVPIPNAPEDVFEEKQSGYLRQKLEAADWKEIIAYIQASPNSWNNLGIEPYGGAINNPNDPNAFIHRDMSMNLFMEVFWKQPEEYDAAVKWLDGFMALVAPWLTGQSYQNYPRPGMKDAQNEYWADYLGTLEVVKSKYNPRNWFANPQHIGMAFASPPNRPPPKGPKFPDAPINYKVPPTKDIAR